MLVYHFFFWRINLFLGFIGYDGRFGEEIQRSSIWSRFLCGWQFFVVFRRGIFADVFADVFSDVFVGARFCRVADPALALVTLGTSGTVDSVARICHALTTNAVFSFLAGDTIAVVFDALAFSTNAVGRAAYAHAGVGDTLTIDTAFA